MQGYFRGLAFPLASYGLLNSILFGVYGNSLRLMTPLAATGHVEKSYRDIFMAGCIGGAAQLIPACPIDVVKITLQAQIAEHGKGNNGNGQFFKGPVEAIGAIYKKHGFRGCFRGLPVMAMRDIPAFGSYLLAYEWMYDTCNLHHWLKNKEASKTLLAGGVAGLCSWTFTMPLDVVKSRMQADLNGKFKNILDCVVKSYAEGGFRIFFSGLPVACLRAFPVNAVTFLVYTKTLKYLNDGESPFGRKVKAEEPQDNTPDELKHKIKEVSSSSTNMKTDIRENSVPNPLTIMSKMTLEEKHQWYVYTESLGGGDSIQLCNNISEV
ncbi:unnamed protein product [Owenia fusiformis]|nr:unnamed protein product [Owenia fusiformis]